MIYSYCVDDEGRVLSVCPDDLSGTSGWFRGDIPISPADDLTDDHGAALYKLDNGAIVPRSREEREADWPAEPEPEPEPEPTATVNIRAGEIFPAEGETYIALRPIARGEKLAPGWNCTPYSIIDALNAQKED